jgi:hypothetical protein
MENNIPKEFIDQMIQDTLEAESRLKYTDKLILQIEDVRLRQKYTNELNEMLTWYKLLQDELIIKLEDYIKQESDNGNIVDLYYRRVLKKLHQ